ncbi:MAG: copper homeostasis periplasmic binding protein CopC [Phenylobacterium sp.]|uniref:copper homeostasis periplasmic binding protein CopC n=1 Tax=Phenylobacterium sp. TaxID=1871053 RepID=UPI001A2B1AFB|nr:copper homeostasis periplasmic binding protein CopC [Phenylobacterium sp.]MBJ7413517.1 copper homeostasis periplasmic binding protein CopC [Phenylobacterium sp.]
MSPVAFRRGLTGVIAGSLLSLTATAAAAHAHLTASSPAADAAVAAPRALTLTFSEPLEPKFSGVALTAPGGGEIGLTVTVSGDRKTLLATPAKPLAPGAYKAKWHAVAKDGHRMEGGYGFTVR